MDFKLSKVIEILTLKKKTLSTMESCTGGFIVSSFTNVDGASNVIKYSAVTYCNDFKIKMGVPADIIDKYTVYSKETARAMACAISNFSSSDYGVGITGKLGTIDKNNKTGDDNEVFVSIYDKANDNYLDLDIFVNGLSRKECKNQILGVIVDKFLEII